MDDDNNETNKRPVHIALIIFLLKIVFFTYDLIVFIPFKIFADPSEKLSVSGRMKAAPIHSSDPRSPWRSINNVDEKLITTTFPECKTLGDQWDESVRKFSKNDCFGTREVLTIHKEKQENGKIYEKWEMGEYHWRTFEAVDNRVNMVASALASLGCKKNDKIIIFAETREEWMTTALACFKSCLPVITVYATLGEEAVEFAIKEVDAHTVFTSENLLPKVLKLISNGLDVQTVIYFESPDPENVQNHEQENVKILSFTQLLNIGKSGSIENKASPEDLAVIMYTSGTTGNPKGVMISHENIVAAISGMAEVVPITPTDTYIGYLPLAHMLELCAELVTTTKGVRIGYSSPQLLFDRAPKIRKGTRGDCYALKPTLIACVPAVMDRIYKSVMDEVNDSGALFREVFHACYRRKRERYEEGYNTFLLNKLVFNRIGKLLGGKIRWVLSGGAPLSSETQRFMNICFCCPVIQGYGLTETCGGGTLADVHDLSTGTVGPPLSCCEILLEDWQEAGYSPLNENPQGEILIGGRNVALGYFKNPEKTKEDFVYRNNKRYFATGDIGEFRKDGSLKIIDRKKDLLKLAHGEYISLGSVETQILSNQGIDNVCVFGDSTKDYLVALVVPNEKYLRKLAKEFSLSENDMDSLCKDKKIIETVLKEIQSHVAGKLQKVEIPKKIFLCSEPWTAHTGLLTEALKLKRKTIEKTFRKELDEMYS
ncbi:Siroheme synthase [Parelaphostrongylus tenuis]|uniref:long-chain-fatty-acid--CoA ligase n=1 Tax=Parelaphostrongylus tenuis TaxID=148309 RepID=A0AAD5N9U2_PARTN|nr:Siroheme synthase [Parelaphostrongylus tenuis]